jgi:DNA-binding transcriptional regulator LsrR (DeoR family)
MARRADLSRDKQAQKAAYLRAQHNMSQEEIGGVLGISQAHVSRLLSRAGEMGCLVTELRFIEQGIPEETLEEIHQLLEPPAITDTIRKIGQQSGRFGPNARVFDSGTDSPTPEAAEMRRRRFGRSAAGRLAELLKQSDVVGVAWGRTVSNLIEGLDGKNLVSRELDPIQFVPTCAELLGLAMPGFSSTRLTERLIDLVNKGNGDRLSLSGVPAYIPRRYKKEQAAAVRQYVYDINSYQKIFRGKFPLASKIDTLLTSIGPPDQPVGGSVADLLTAAGIKAEKLQSLVIGDMGGVLIRQPTLDRSERRLINELNLMWTGLQYEHLEHIAREAAQNPRRTGNIVVAIGQDKAPVLIEIIRLGLVNEIIIDQDLARALVQAVNS